MNNKFKIAVEINKILRMAENLNRTELSDEQKNFLNTIIKAGINALTLNIGDTTNTDLLADKEYVKGTKVSYILFADDSKTSRKLIESLLHKTGYKVKVVDDGVQAIAALREESFDLVILDINMPNMDGIETTKTIREGKYPEINKNVPIVAFTAYFDAKDPERFSSAGINDYILKPIKVNEFFNVLNKYIQADNTEPQNLGLLNDSKVEKRRSPDLNSAAIVKTNSSTDPIGITILIAEDNDINLRVTESLLKKKGWKFIPATNGKEALKALKEHPEIDIILMDIQMPVMDGIEATATIRDMEKKTDHHLPIIALTAHIRAEDREKYLDSGMDDYISKPINKDDFYHIIEKHIAILLSERNKDNSIINLKDSINNVFCGDKNLYIELVENFISSYDAELNELLRAIDSKDYKKVETTAHKLKGTLGNFRFNAAYELAVQLEKMGRDTDISNASAVFNTLSLALSNLKRSFSDPSWKEVLKEL